MNQDNIDNFPALIIIRGIPGSGKSYIADKLLDQLNINNAVLLDPDRIDINSIEYQNFTEELKENNVDSKLFPYRYLRNLSYETIDQKGLIIWTQAFTNQDMLDRTIKNLTSYAEQKQSNLKVLIVDVLVDQKTSRERINIREKQGYNGVSNENFNRFINDFKPFEDYEYDVLNIDGTDDVSNSVEVILNRFRNT